MVKLDDRLATFPRVESYEVRVLSKTGRDLGVLDGVSGGNITMSTDARIKTGGKLYVKDVRSPEWWDTRMLQVFVTVNGYKWSLGVFIPSSPQVSYRDVGTEFEIELHDKLLIFDQDCVPSAYSIPKGRVLRDEIIKLIESVGETRYNIAPFEPSFMGDIQIGDGTNKRPMTWDAGTPKLTIINDILDYIGYFSLFADPSGQFVAAKYVIPAERPVAWSLVEGSQAVFSVDWSFEQDLANIPNRVVYSTQESETPEGQKIPLLVSVLENTDSTSPYSYQSRGRWITEVKTDAEAESQAVLDKMVKRRMNNAMNPMAKVVIQNAVLPFRLNDIVRFKARDRDMFMSVRKMEFTLQGGMLAKTTLRKVNK